MLLPLYFLRQALLLSLALLAFGLTGCSSVRVHHKDPSFTFENLSAGGLAIGSVTKPDTINYYAERPIAEFLHSRFSEGWPGVKVLSMEQVEAILGTNDFREMKISFYEEGSLGSEAFPLLRPLGNEVRYLMMVDMRQDDAHSYDVTGYRPQYDTFYNPDTRRYETYQTGGEYVRTRGSSRRIDTAFVVYDLQTAQEVWLGTTTASGGFSDTDTDWLFIPKVRGTGNYSPTDLLDTIGKDLLKRLPRPGK
ncbi:MAG: hypothetical protein ACO1QB_06375 [Verrucomicrobiales bacterium]